MTPPTSRPSLDDVRSGTVTMADFRISAATLRRQAEVARAHANPQLAENLERARRAHRADGRRDSSRSTSCCGRGAPPPRSSGDGRGPESRGAPRSAALVREAAEVYARRGLLRA